MKFRVVFFDAFAFLEGAASGAHAKTEIPQRAREIGDERTKLRFGFFVAKQKENIQIRVGEKQAATVAPKGYEAEPLRLGVVDSQDFSKNLLGSAIGKFAKRAQRVLRASAGFKPLPDTLPFVLGQWSEDGQGS